ncbi:MAG: GNAT family N-acetyltransferase [Aliihoeflea sp.]
MSRIEIRPARPHDRDAIEALLRASWLDHWAPYVSERSVARFHDENPVAAYLDAHLGSLDVLTVDDRVAGIAHVKGDMLHALHVATERIGSGLGARLLAHAEAKGARRLEVRAFNTRAHGFYLAQGWSESRRYLASEMGSHAVTLEMVRA